MDLKELHEHGQSIWLDYIRRDLLSSGELARLVRDDDIRGVTTNPSILEKAIAESTDYDSALRRDVRQTDEATAAIYERLVIEDIHQAAEVLRPTYDVKAAIDEGVPAPILATALAERSASRGAEDFANRILSAMRYQFGGHNEKKTT